MSSCQHDRRGNPVQIGLKSTAASNAPNRSATRSNSLLNPKRLRQVFYNLIHNATDAMPGGGRIFLRFQQTNGQVVTEIEDTGPGIASEIADRLFDAFATFGKAHGTGLGLSICKKIVEDHHGQISARNEPNRGAVFSFSLPLYQNP